MWWSVESNVWKPNLTIGLDPNTALPDPLPLSIDLQYTIYYMYQ
jgi:hypothetical protein